MELIKPNTKIPFANFWTQAFIISMILVVVSVAFFFFRVFIQKDFNWGTDFSGGTGLQIRFETKPEIGKIRSVVEAMGFKDAAVTNFGGEDTRDVLIRIAQTSEKGTSISTKLVEALQTQFGKEQVKLQRVDEVGPKVGRDLKVNGIISIIIALVGIFAYIWFRFTPEFAPGAIVALIHDVLVSLGAFTLMNYEFELSTLAALLTIVGYSIYDTIVIYDRIRDELKHTKWGNYQDVVVKSLNETLSRTMLTSLMTFLVVLSLFLFAQGEIRNFAFIMMMGIITGTYSSVFVASPILVWLVQWLQKRNVA